MIRKHSAKVLTLRNIVRSYSNFGDETIHFVLIGGSWYYNGTSSLSMLSKTQKDGFWEYDIKYILEDGPKFSYEKVIEAFYHGPNKSMQIATREWTTNQTFYGVPY
ncbi:hypothetical protein QNH00_gp27 [Yersinia phage PYps16N]|uniref:Uncharacterized protein n=1 Tax=Yersinia phage PYps16N TaxID=2801354 RepID=A0AAE7P476_9CAUD|nr:hypothetical protein QNH00_gp27 [Yersinia phage PYps16N]QQO91200.1 hypothetical protein ORF027 [Yersinia phage PYps16N]